MVVLPSQRMGWAQSPEIFWSEYWKLIQTKGSRSRTCGSTRFLKSIYWEHLEPCIWICLKAVMISMALQEAISIRKFFVIWEFYGMVKTRRKFWASYWTKSKYPIHDVFFCWNDQGPIKRSFFTIYLHNIVEDNFQITGRRIFYALRRFPHRKRISFANTTSIVFDWRPWVQGPGILPTTLLAPLLYLL